MQKRSDVDEDGKEIEDLANELTTLDLNVMEEAFEGKLAEGCDLCGESGLPLCWHKVEEKFEFVFRVSPSILLFVQDSSIKSLQR